MYQQLASLRMFHGTACRDDIQVEQRIAGDVKDDSIKTLNPSVHRHLHQLTVLPG